MSKTQSDFRALLASNTSEQSQASTSSNPYLGSSSKSSSSKKKSGDGKSGGGGGGNGMVPRNLKNKKEKGYRDRAEERRLGRRGEWEEVEGVQKSFQERMLASDPSERAVLEQQRQYLGGDAEHTVLVKGLDFALLERNKALMMNDGETEMDDELEGVLQAPNEPSEKKTKLQIIQELKAKRAEEEQQSLQRAKAQGLFKAVGKKEEPAVKKKKRKGEKEVDGTERKKKKRKVLEPEVADPTPIPAQEPVAPTAAVKPSTKPEIDLEGFEDADIFADATEWKPDFSDEEEEDAPQKPTVANPPPEQEPDVPHKYFDDDAESDSEGGKEADEIKLPDWLTSKRPPPEEEKQPEKEYNPYSAESSSMVTRLEGLSSSMPSIKELLSLDDAAERDEKRKARKDKFKGIKSKEKKELTEAQKANRDFQKYQAYEKKRNKDE
ncbi:hypothetical protein BT69DRAFT_1347572 [Atractiella rhizophila]|nr:hypothetical protein BT69DRAFT_1347572 [Atractiella rhizophila]